MTSLSTDAAVVAQWPSAERVRALKRLIPRAKVQEVLRRTGHARRRYLRLPAWFMIWFVIALGLFCRDSYRQVFKWLQPFRRKGTPGRSTFCEARQRLGVAPLHHLVIGAVDLQAEPDTPGAFYQGWRLMSLDGFVVDVPDSPSNARVFGRPGSGRSQAAFPQVRVLALCEVGTHVLWRTLLKPCHRGEVTMASAAANCWPAPRKTWCFTRSADFTTARTWPSFIARRRTATQTEYCCGSSSTRWTIRGARGRAKSTGC
jgi:hypothetical protein